MRQLALIVSVFLFFFGVLFYFALRTILLPEDGYDSRDNISVEQPGSEADSLLQKAYDAVSDRDFIAFQSAFDSLHLKYPFSRQAAEVAKLAEVFDPEITEMTVSADVDPPARDVPAKSKPRQRKKAPVKRPAPIAEVPVSTELADDPLLLDASLIEVTEPVALSQFEYDRILSRMRQVRNERTGITYYYHKHISHFVYKNSVEAYVAQNDAGDTWLRLRIYFCGEEPLSIKQYEFYGDDRSFSILSRFGTVESGSGEAGHWEWFDMRSGDREERIILAVMNSDRTAIKYHGSERIVERALTEREKLRLVQVYNAYNALRHGKQYFSPSAEVSGSR